MRTIDGFPKMLAGLISHFKRQYLPVRKQNGVTSFQGPLSSDPGNEAENGV